MKTSDLITLLQKLDPDGNIDVCIGNAPITDCTKNASYYDGKKQKILYDSHNIPLVGMLCSSGYKINLMRISISDCIEQNPFFTVIREDHQPVPSYEQSWIDVARSDSLKLYNEICVTYCNVEKKV